MAITADRNTPRKDGVIESYDMAELTKAYFGGMAQIVSGYAKPAAATQEGPIPGRFDEQKDNSTGSDGDKEVLIRSGVFKWDNSSGSPVTQAHLQKPCYCEDDETVCSDASKPFAGIVDRVDSDGVWVYMAKGLSPSAAAVGAGSWAATQTLAAGTALVFSPNQKYYPVVGSGGAVTLTADFPDGSYAGQEIILVGTHDTNKVTVPTGKNTKTADGLSVELADDCFLPMVWDGSDWVQSGPMVHAA